MHVLPAQHVGHALGLVGIKAQALHPLGRIGPGAEQQVPDGQAVVLRMVAVLVVHGVHLGPLHDVSQPARRADVGMQEQIERPREADGEGSRQRAGPQHPVAGQRAQQHGGRRVHGVGEKRRERLHARRAVVQLVEQAPQRVRPVRGAVPPVEDKAGQHKAQRAHGPGRPLPAHVQQRMATDAVREQMAYRQGGGQRAQAQQRGQDQPAPVAMVARGRRDHLAREDADEHQRQQRVGRELPHLQHAVRSLPLSARGPSRSAHRALRPTATRARPRAASPWSAHGRRADPAARGT